jgi:hypothetical protein
VTPDQKIALVSLIVSAVSLAVCALCLVIALAEMAHNNRVILKVLSCESTYIQSLRENKSQPFWEFKIRLRNQGISLYDPLMALCFRDSREAASCTFPIKRRDGREQEPREFARGMIAEFYLRSSELTPADMPMLGMLKDFQFQEAELVVASQGYTVHRIRMGGFRDRLATRWNRLAYKVNKRFDRVKDGVVHSGHVLPIYLAIASKLSDFIRRVRIGDEKRGRS